MPSSSHPQKNEYLRRERLRRNWRQQDLAEQLETSPETVKRWENGWHQPSAYFRARLCALFEKSAAELGLLADEPPSTTPSEQPTRLWLVPYRRNPHFTGRDDLLDQLDRQFTPEYPEPIAATQQVVLSQPQAIQGLGGVGKTQIALEYAYRSRQRERYTHIFWVNGANEEAIITSFQAIAERLPHFAAKDEQNHHQLVTAIQRWLQECQHPWLLIVDNADDLSLVQPYLPQQGPGHILLTTRASAVAALATALEVEQMGLMEGTQFLLHRSRRLHATDEERNEASNIVIALNGFPLALDQAGAYLEETGCSFGDYLQLYEQHHNRLLARRGRQTTNYPASVATTWELSFQQIEQANPAAADLLRLCAFLAPDHIPEELLCAGAPHWPPLLQEAVSNLLAFNQMMEDLLAYSLIKRSVEVRMFSLHRLVQVVQQARMTREEQRHWAQRVVYAVHAVFPADPQDDVVTWPQCQRYLEQVQCCDRLIQQHAFGFAEATDVLTRAGAYLCEHALYTLAEPLFQRAFSIGKQQPEAQQTRVAAALYGLADVAQAQGKYAEAEPLFQQSLRLREQQLGPDHPKVGGNLSGLAYLYLQQGKYTEAEPLLRRALRIWEQRLGPDHPKVAYPLNSLAILLVKQGKHVQGELFYQRALRIWEQQLGPDHPNVAYALNNLATLCYEQGKYAEAEPLYLRALRLREQQLGPDHPKVASPLINLGELYLEVGKDAEAVSVLQRALCLLERQSGPDHEMVAYPLINLGDLSRKQGKYTEAERLYQRAWRILEHSLGSEHLHLIGVLLGLAHLYGQQGNYQQAEPLYRQALAIQEQQAAFSYSAAEVLHDFAWFQEAQGNNQEARSWYTRAYTMREQLLGPLHPKTKETYARLTALLYS